MDRRSRNAFSPRRARIAALCGVALVCAGCQFSRPTMPRGGEIKLPGGVTVRQPENAETPATARVTYRVAEPVQESGKDPANLLPKFQLDGQSYAVLEVSTGQPSVTDTTEIETTKAELKAREPLMYAGLGCIILGLLVATLLKYPTPGGLLALTGAALLGMHSYPRLGFVAAALGAAAIGIYLGHEIGERKAATPSPTTPVS